MFDGGKRTMSKTKIGLAISGGLLIISFILAQEAHPVFPETTVTTQRLSYDPGGTPVVSEITRSTWRSDGSKATESLVTVLLTGETKRSGTVRDLESRRHSLLFPDLHLRVVRNIPEPAVHTFHQMFAQCDDRVATLGEQVGDDIFVRRVRLSDGSEVVRRYDPEAGCEEVEFTHTVDGVIRNTLRMLNKPPASEATLFEIDPSLEAATRTEINTAHLEKYGIPLLGIPPEKLLEMDRNSPPILDR
jgi:hypothetical protein